MRPFSSTMIYSQNYSFLKELIQESKYYQPCFILTVLYAFSEAITKLSQANIDLESKVQNLEELVKKTVENLKEEQKK